MTRSNKIFLRTAFASLLLAGFFAAESNACASVDEEVRKREMDHNQMRENMDSQCHQLFVKYQQSCMKKIQSLPERQNRAPGDESSKTHEGYVRKYQEKYETECGKLLRGEKKPSTKGPYNDSIWKCDFFKFK